VTILLLAALVLALLILQFTVFSAPDDGAITEQGGQVEQGSAATRDTPPAAPADTGPETGQGTPGVVVADTGSLAGAVFGSSEISGVPPAQPSLPPAEPAPAAIQGRVQAGPGQPAAYIVVFLTDAGGVFTGDYTISGNDGSFSFEGLRPGSYKLYFTDMSGALESAWYGSEGSPEGTSIVLGAGDEARVTQTLRGRTDATGAISGRVTDECTGIPFAPCGVGIAGVLVSAYRVDPQGGSPADLAASALTDYDGEYLLDGLSPGGYKVYFRPSAGNYLPQWYQGRSSGDEAKVIEVRPAETVEKIDAVLATPGGTISGVVTDGAKPLAAAKVDIFSETGVMAGSYLTDGQGRYRTARLPVGSYRVRASLPGTGLVARWYRGAYDFISADAVAVADGQEAAGVDVELSSPVVVSTDSDDTGVVLGAAMPPAGGEGAMSDTGNAAETPGGLGGCTAAASGQDGVTGGESEYVAVTGEHEQKLAVEGQEYQPQAVEVDRGGSDTVTAQLPGQV
jgi:protocatechuate 3,4-dioxygenase beta subunit